ncbi:membrane hypothetical protein [Vibrio chagasii]|nr:membrane hypothetical protein [Vibrio chagasii]
MIRERSDRKCAGGFLVKLAEPQVLLRMEFVLVIAYLYLESYRSLVATGLAIIGVVAATHLSVCYIRKSQSDVSLAMKLYGVAALVGLSYGFLIGG